MEPIEFVSNLKEFLELPGKPGPGKLVKSLELLNDVNNILCLGDDVPTIEDLNFIDDMIAEHNVENSLPTTKHKNEKKKHDSVKQLDQLDGVPTKKNEKEQPEDDDEKVVKCFYYTLMCCECSIS